MLLKDGTPILYVERGGKGIVRLVELEGDHLAQRMRGRRPMANATDLAYLWAAWSVDATVVTLDEGMRAHHGVVCDVTSPEHALRRPGRDGR